MRLHTTSGGAERIHAHMEEWLQTEWWDWKVYVANVTFGVFAEGARFEARAKGLRTRLKVLLRGMWERKQALSNSELVFVGKNTSINPTAQIQGPTWIGDNCYIGPGVVIQNSIIGNNVNRLKVGYVLRLPGAEAATEQSRREARAELLELNEVWRAESQPTAAPEVPEATDDESAPIPMQAPGGMATPLSMIALRILAFRPT